MFVLLCFACSFVCFLVLVCYCFFLLRFSSFFWGGGGVYVMVFNMSQA